MGQVERQRDLQPATGKFGGFKIALWPALRSRESRPGGGGAAAGQTAKERMGLLLAAADRKFTPLHLACENGHAEVASLVLQGLEAEQKMRLLLAAGDQQVTPLHAAFGLGHAKTACSLLQDLSEAQALRLLQLQNGCPFGSPVSLAVSNGHWAKLSVALASLAAEKSWVSQEITKLLK